MNASFYINLATSIITFVLGILLLTGIIYPGNKDSTKIVFGIVLLIYGLYRFINSFSKMKQAKQQERHEKMIEEREKLLNR
ncbi:MAG: hypothetical protein LH629_02130 [Ignavibacteria bacterium]|nr:hypothetical protein [Ignavibacteria bacterium]